MSVTETVPRIGLAMSGALLFTTGLYFITRKADADDSLPKAEDYEVKITFPQQDERIDKVHVQGTLEKALPKNYALWVFRGYEDGKFFPLRQCVISGNGGSREAKLRQRRGKR